MMLYVTELFSTPERRYRRSTSEIQIYNADQLQLASLMICLCTAETVFSGTVGTVIIASIGIALVVQAK